MAKTLKKIFLVFLSVAFLAMAVVCCCALKSALYSMQKASCSHCSNTKKAPTAPTSHECCFTKASPMEVFKNVSLPTPLVSFWILAFVSLLYITPNPRLVPRSIYLNGPPGLIVEAPLYIQARSLRI